jgi:uroporphyrinogen III methyltransferase/synthase
MADRSGAGREVTPKKPRHAGRVDLVGAGPGDPGLITVLGRRALESADVVVYDHLIEHRLLDLAPQGAERVFAGKRAGRAVLAQAAINALLVDRARLGLRVVRLKGGDPLVFGRGSEEAEHLRGAGVPFRIVPGVTAGVGVTAYAGLPITQRGIASAVAFVTGHDDPESPNCGVDWAALARFPGTLVVYMGLAHLRSICGVLMREGMPGGIPAALVASGTTGRQNTVEGTVASLADLVEARGIKPPGLLVIGPVVARRPELDWFEQLPLFGQRIVVTRPAGDSANAAEDLEALGAEVLAAPMVTIEPPADWGPVDRAIATLETWDWLVFTSRNGVDVLLRRLLEVGRDLRELAPVRIAAIGSGTAEALRSRGLRADLVPPEFVSESLVESLAPLVGGKRVLLARADRGRTLLRDELARIAGAVEQIAVYRNVDVKALPSGVSKRLEEGSVDWVTLTSSAIAERFAALLPEAARGRVGSSLKVATLSAVTTGACAKLGWPVAVEASESTWAGLVEALEWAVWRERTAAGLGRRAGQASASRSGELAQGLVALPEDEGAAGEEKHVERDALAAEGEADGEVE